MSEPVQFGRYVLERRIAIGGMGEVFLARQTGPSGFDRPCVVKRMHPHLESDPETSSMFLEEAQLTAKINHPFVAQVYDFGRIDTAFFLVMEFVDGPSLGAVTRHYRAASRFVPLDFICRVVSQAAQALDHAHRLKDPAGLPLELVHRDISPENLMVSKDGLTKVIDFGIAKARTTAKRTQIGAVRGKLGYLSPEQLDGQPIDARTDVCALGLVMYELVTGRRAVLGHNDLEMLANVRARAWPSADTLRPDCPPALLDVLAKATELNRAARYQTMSELSAALEAIIVAQGWSPLPQRLGAIATEVVAPPSKIATGFDSPTDTDVSVQAVARAAAVTARHDARGAPPWQRPTEPERSGVHRRSAPSQRALVLVLAGVVLAVALGVAALLWPGEVQKPDVKMPAPGPPPEVVMADAGTPMR